ncbi:MAG: FecR domain-containing protein [Pseudomonas sp.]|uniref:FecR domain-containing protein n=1 Tax=Pseudomonas sp. TaxID=306 RepID=UPI003D1348B7
MSRVSARALDEAISWQLCLDSGEASDQQRHEFQHWLAAHPDHARVWQQLGGIDQQLGAAASPVARRALLQSGGVRRRSLRRLGKTTLGLLLTGGVLLGLLAQQRPLGDYLTDQHTAAGEQRELLLPDRSAVRLNSLSALDIAFSDHERRLILRSGEILVQTAPGDKRPFLVETAQGQLRALGTRFLVRRDGDATELVVLQSAVAARPNHAPQERVIQAGQQVRMNDRHLGDSQPAPVGADAWARGMLVADNLRLADLLDTLGQYRGGYLGLDDSLADLRISGSFPLHDSELALEALSLSLPVRIEHVGPWWTRVVPAGE